MTVMISAFLADLREVFAGERSAAGLHVDAELCQHFADGLTDAIETAQELEACARSCELLGTQHFTDVVRSLPLADRRALARQTLRTAEAKVLRPDFGRRRPSGQQIASEFVDCGDPA